jgi:methionine-rich copper-binding protein CopC
MIRITRCLAATALVMTALAAHAHSHLARSTPADGAVLETAPTSLTLEFSEPVTLTAVTVSAERQEKRALTSLPTKAATTFDLPITGLAVGHYVVTWRALSADTHVMTGELAFSVGGDAAAAAHQHAEQAEHAEHDAAHHH